MMNGWSGSLSAWEWVWMFVGLLALWALAGVGVVAATRFLRQGGGASRRELEPAPRLGAEELLADRFARGEIGEDEYWQRLHALRAAKE